MKCKGKRVYKKRTKKSTKSSKSSKSSNYNKNTINISGGGSGGGSVVAIPTQQPIFIPSYQQPSFQTSIAVPNKRNAIEQVKDPGNTIFSAVRKIDRTLKRIIFDNDEVVNEEPYEKIPAMKITEGFYDNKPDVKVSSVGRPKKTYSEEEKEQKRLEKNEKAREKRRLEKKMKDDSSSKTPFK